MGSCVASFVACSNAYVGVDPDPAVAATSASDAMAQVDASGVDTVDSSDAADAADAADAVDPCDKDDDGYLAVACDGGDCDDDDPRAHPAADAGFITSLISSVTVGDWNCDGVVTKQFGYDLNCGALSMGANCVTVSGFVGDPACGENCRVDRQADPRMPLA